MAPFVPGTCPLITLEILPPLPSLCLLGRQPWQFGINLSLFHPQSGYFGVFTEPLVIYIELRTFLDGGTINKWVSSHWVRGSVTAQVYLLCMCLHTRDLRKCLLPHPVRLNTYSNLKGALPWWLRLSSLRGYQEGSQCSVTRQPVSQCLQYPGWMCYFSSHSWAGKEILNNLTDQRPNVTKYLTLGSNSIRRLDSTGQEEKHRTATLSHV